MPSTLRKLTILGAFVCASLMAAALYFQHVMGLEPCPLCIFQRLAVIASGVVLLIAAVHNPTALGRRIYGVLTLLSASSGAAVAARHLWLQSLPADQVPACGPGLDYMLETFPLNETLAMVFTGSGECAEVQWRLLGLSMPGWTLLFFIAVAFLGGLLIMAKDKKTSYF